MVVNPNFDPTTQLIFELADVGAMAVDKVYDLVHLACSKKYRQAVARQKANQLIWKLKQRGYIEAATKGKKVVYVLSAKGKIKLLKKQIARAKNLPSGKLLVVIFDIPRRQGRARDVFRGFLKRTEFQKVQQSVWVTNQDVYKIITGLVDELGIREWINIFYGSDFLIQPDLEIRK